MALVAEVGIPYRDVLFMPVGVAISTLNHHREMQFEKHKIEEVRVRRLCYFSSTMTDHKDTKPDELYPLPWEHTKYQPIEKNTARDYWNQQNLKAKQ